MSKELSDLEEEMETTIELLMNGEMDVQRAKAINKAISNRINSIKVRIVYALAINEKPDIHYIRDSRFNKNKFKVLGE